MSRSCSRAPHLTAQILFTALCSSPGIEFRTRIIGQTWPLQSLLQPTTEKRPENTRAHFLLRRRCHPQHSPSHVTWQCSAPLARCLARRGLVCDTSRSSFQASCDPLRRSKMTRMTMWEAQTPLQHAPTRRCRGKKSCLTKRVHRPRDRCGRAFRASSSKDPRAYRFKQTDARAKAIFGAKRDFPLSALRDS